MAEFLTCVCSRAKRSFAPEVSKFPCPATAYRRLAVIWAKRSNAALIDMSIFLSGTSQASAASALQFLTAKELDGELAAAGVLRFELD
jgi:hypothetical protein